jgi:hypothetical protein
MNQKDAKLLGAVYSLLLQTGAISVDRALRILGEPYFERDIQWAFFQLDCKEGGGLWTLPDEKLPLNERRDQEIEIPSANHLF